MQHIQKKSNLSPKHFPLGSAKKWSLIAIFLGLCFTSFGQSYTPCSTAVKLSNFGLDGDFNANTPAALTGDDWFLSSAFPGSDIGVIGTSAATAKPPLAISAAAFKAILQAAKNVNGRNITYQQGMSVPGGSIIKGQLLVDAVAARDNIGVAGSRDSSQFQSSSSKNGDNPGNWSLGIGSTPNKNDLIDVGGHVRVDISNNHAWGFAFATTLSEDGTSHTDFEVYRTMPTFDAKGGKVTGSGPAATGGHTAFVLNPDGTTKQPGDFLVSVDFSNGGTNVRASVRVWVNPANVDNLGHDTAFINAQPNRAFTFTGVYNSGIGANGFGYAEIKPVNPTGNCLIAAVENKTATTGTPWGNLHGSQAQYSDNLSSYQLVEVAIDFTAFGLAQVNVNGACDVFLGDLLVKTRSSDSFSAELKDYAGPYHFFAK